jgi:DNA-binding XRE family transcriptional regulator
LLVAPVEAHHQMDPPPSSWGRDGFAMTIGVTARVYREIEAGDRTPSLDTYRRISELYGWPQTFVWER